MSAPRPSRPDLVDTFVELWLSAAVGLAAVATAPLHAFRPGWAGEAQVPEEEPASEDPFPEYEVPLAASTVSPVRPTDLPLASPESGLAGTETCGNCRHFHRANAQAGECRHDPPFPGERGGSEWPVTADREWCGRFFKAYVPGLTREELDGLN